MAASTPSSLSSKSMLSIANLENALRNIEKLIEPVLAKPLNEINDSLLPIDSVKFNLTMAYVLNGLFWTYLVTIGENPEEHKVDYGLDRIRNYMNTLDEVIAKEHAPRLDVGAAKRFLNASLSTPKDKKGTKRTVKHSPNSSNKKKKHNSSKKGHKRNFRKK